MVLNKISKNSSLLLNVLLNKLPLYLLLIPLILVNLFEFAEIDSGIGARYKALYAFDTPNIVEVGAQSPSIRPTILPWTTLAHIAPDSTLYIPAEGQFPVAVFNNRFYAFAEGDEVKVVSIDGFEKLIHQFNPDQYIVAIGQSKPGYESSFAIALSGDANRGLEKTEFPRFLIDEDLQPQPETKFLLLEWRNSFQQSTQLNNSDQSVNYRLFVDIELLPMAVQEGLLAQ